MKTLIKKEIRLLLPAWIAAMLLAIVPRIFVILYSSPGNPRYFQNSLSFVAGLIFAVGLLILGINSFGQELSCNTFSALLSQPMNRPRIWRIKVTTLATAFVSVWLAGILLASLQWGIYQLMVQGSVHPDLSDVRFLTISALVTFSGGLWATLLLRQITSAFWITLLAPLAIIEGINVVFQDRVAAGNSVDAFIAVALVLYSVAGFFLARRLFMRAQDVQWTGGEISLPRAGKAFNSGTSSLSVRPRHWLPALVWKEFQLQQGTFLIAAILLLVHVGGLYVRKFHPESFLDGLFLLWLLMPVLVGAAAIAEERRMGTLELQLCLPVSRGVQLFVKFCTGLVLSLVFGALMPLVIERMNILNDWPDPCIVTAAIFFVSFYASSLARSTLQGIGLAIIVALTIYAYEALTLGNSMRLGMILYGYTRIGLELQNYLGPPIFVIVLGWLTVANFKHAQQNRKFWLRNITAILVAFICIPFLARAIYFRAWEVFPAFESRGPVRITSPGQVKFASTSGDIYSISPDGRLWVEPLAYDQVPNGSQSMFNPTSPILSPDRCRGRFIGESNWMAVAANDFEAAGIRSDGTLWNLPTSGSPLMPQASRSSTTTQIGTDSDWTQVAGGYNGFLILKKDGSLWKWATQSNQPDSSGTNKLERDLAALPLRVGDKTNWTSVFSDNRLAGARNSRGGTQLFFAHPFIGTNSISQALSLQSTLAGVLEVKTNGELWYFNNSEIKIGTRFHPTPMGRAGGQQLAENWKWRAAEFGLWSDTPNGAQYMTAQYMMAPNVIAIRDDGTLWKISLGLMYPYKLYSQQLVQLGHRSDWVTLAGGFALASDGSVWAWGVPSRHAWLARSRRPVRMGNIFEEPAD